MKILENDNEIIIPHLVSFLFTVGHMSKNAMTKRGISTKNMLNQNRHMYIHTNMV